MPIIETESLTRSYGRRRGIEAVDLAVPEGAIFGFLGPNGAGKTTAIRVLVGLLRPSRGTARILGLDCWRDGRRVKAEIGYMPGDLRLYSWLDGAAALRIFGRVRGRNLVPYGRQLAERLGLDLRVKVRKMSRGMRQKLGLILTLAHRPRLLVLDEPTVTLDPLAQLEVHRLLSEMAAAGHTVFFSSHTLSEVEQLCDRVAMIREGRLVADESLEALRGRAGHEVTIRWRDAEAARATEPPAFLRLGARDRAAGLLAAGEARRPGLERHARRAGRAAGALAGGPHDRRSGDRPARLGDALSAILRGGRGATMNRQENCKVRGLAHFSAQSDSSISSSGAAEKCA